MGRELLRDARFWTALILVVKAVLFYAAPDFPLSIGGAVDALLAVVIGAMAGQSAVMVRRATDGRGLAERRAERYQVSGADVAVGLGAAMLIAGVAVCDWRLALLVGGGLLLSGGAWGIARGA